MGRWDNSGRNYGKGLSQDNLSEITRQRIVVVHCKSCIHRELNVESPQESRCKITSLSCLEAIPICQQWQFKETITKQPVYVAKYQD